MTDTQIDAGVVGIEDDGTGVPDAEETYISASYLNSLPHVRTQAILDGLGFTPDYGSPAVEVGAGVASVPLSGGVVQSASQPTYDTTLPGDSYQLVILPNAVSGLSLDAGTVNEIWVAHDPTSQDSVYVRHGSGLSEPSGPSVKLGEVDTSNDIASGRWYAADHSGILSFPTEAAALEASNSLDRGVVHDRANNEYYKVT